MELKPHLLDQWLQQHSEPPPEFDLGSSTGPHWRLRELLELGGEEARQRLLETELVYSRSPGSTALRRAIAEMQGVAAEQVLVTAGAAEALTCVFLVTAEPGANVVVPSPCFPPHRTLPEALGLEVRSYALKRARSYRIDLDEVRRLIDDKTKMILVNLPNNPTGAAITDNEMGALHDFATERGVQFLSDEVHHPIYHGPKTRSAARLPRASTIGDFSKAFSLPGLRLGWVIEPDARRREQYLNAREYVTITNSPLTELIAEIAVRHRETLWGRTRAVTQANLRLLDGFMADHADRLRWVRPEGGMTAFPWLVSGRDTRAFCREAVRHGLLLAPGDCFGAPDHFRIGFGVSEEWFPRAIDRFDHFLRRAAPL